MRAYMSGASSCNEMNRGEWLSPKAAIQEAKRILADVEPINLGTNYNVRMFEPILAKALENFVQTLDKMGH